MSHTTSSASVDAATAAPIPVPPPVTRTADTVTRCSW
jgi:hypothetical protein